MHVYCLVRHFAGSASFMATWLQLLWLLLISAYYASSLQQHLDATFLSSNVYICRLTSQRYARCMMASFQSILFASVTGRSMVMPSSAMLLLRTRCKSTSGELRLWHTAQTCGATTLSSSRTMASALDQYLGDRPHNRCSELSIAPSWQLALAYIQQVHGAHKSAECHHLRLPSGLLC